MKYFAEILKQFSPKARMTALILLLLSLIIMLSIRAFTAKSDCSIQQKQIDDCIKSQAIILQANNDIVERNRKLFLILDSMIGRIKPDTVVIVQKIDNHPIQTESFALARQISDSNAVSTVANLAKTYITSKTETKKIKKGNSLKILSDIRDLMSN